MKQKERHHIIPRSKGGKKERKNIVMVCGDEHDRYHSLFQNKTPDEILEYLTNTFWGGNYKIVKEFAKKN